MSDILECMENKIIFLVIMAVGFFLAFSPYLPEKVRTDIGFKPKVTPKNIPEIRYMPLGDSYTIGESVAPEHRFPNQLVQRLQSEGYPINLLENPARTGYTTKDLLQNQIPVLEKSDANFISILIGVNNQFQNVPAETFRNQFSQILAETKSAKPDAKIIVLTIPDYSLTPYGETTGEPAEIRQKLVEYNTIIKELAAKEKIPVADIWEASSKVATESDLLSFDQLHPNKKQYGLWVEVLYPEVISLIGN